MLASTCAGSKAGVVRRTSTAERPDDESSDVAVKTASMTSVASIAPPPNHQASTLHGLQQVGHDVGRSMHNLLHPVDSLLDDDWEDEITPLNKVRPNGRDGLISQVAALPPLSVGDRVAIPESLVRIRLLKEYENTT
mgnify:CR=1 FL=1